MRAEPAYSRLFGELQSHYDRYKNELATARLWKEAPEVGIGAEFDLGSHLVRFQSCSRLIVRRVSSR